MWRIRVPAARLLGRRRWRGEEERLIAAAVVPAAGGAHLLLEALPTYYTSSHVCSIRRLLHDIRPRLAPRQSEPVLLKRNYAFSCIDARSVKELESFANLKLEGGKFLRLPEVLACLWGYDTESSEPVLLKRKCYDDLFRMISGYFGKRVPMFVKGLAFVGTPGIGKSGLCIFTLWHLLQKKSEWHAIVLKFHRDFVFYIFQNVDGAVQVRVTDDAAEAGDFVFNCKRNSQIAWYLADWQIRVDHSALPCRFLLFTSPNKDNYHQFTKQDYVRIRYVPVWSLEELCELNAKVFHHKEEEVAERYHRWGGVPRYVLAKTHSEDQSILLRAIKQFRPLFQQMQLSYSTFNSASIERDDSRYTHRLVHWNVDEASDFKEATLMFASPYVAKELISDISLSKLDFYLNSAVDSHVQGLQAELFDLKFDTFLREGGCWYQMAVLEVISGKICWSSTKSGQLTKPLKFMGLPVERGNDAELPSSMPVDVLMDSLLKPLGPRNATWDAISGRSIYQATVTSEPRLVQMTENLKKAISFLEEVLGKPAKDDEFFQFVMLVPKYRFDSFVVSLPSRDGMKGRQSVVNEFAKRRVKIVKMCVYTRDSEKELLQAAGRHLHKPEDSAPVDCTKKLQ